MQDIWLSWISDLIVSLINLQEIILIRILYVSMCVTLCKDVFILFMPELLCLGLFNCKLTKDDMFCLSKSFYRVLGVLSNGFLNAVK